MLKKLDGATNTQHWFQKRNIRRHNGDWGEIYKPKDFTENGNIATFTNGTGAIAIQVTRKGSGVMGIYTSDAFDTSNFPDEWGELWKDEWQGKPWEDDWWQNTWQEDDEN